MDREYVAHTVAGLTGVALAVAILEISPPGGGPDVPLAVFILVPNLLMVVVGYFLGRYAMAIKYWSLGVATFIGICAGVISNAIYDFSVYHVEHNLFPINIVLKSVMAIPGVIGGLALARFSVKDVSKAKEPPRTNR